MIKITTYEEIGALKNTQRTRHVLIHIVHKPNEISAAETPLLDVFVCLDATDIPVDVQKQYLVEQTGKYAIFTK